MSQDAFAIDDALAALVDPIVNGRAAVAYGRQIPRRDAHLFERLLRDFNYPSESHVRTLEDAWLWGAYLTFCSNAFAAWNNHALDEIGGFKRTLSHEDAIATAMLIQRGHAVAYVAEAEVEHSHRYTVRSDFERYFDAGYARTQYADVLGSRRTHGKLGRRYVQEVVRHVLHEEPRMVPATLLHFGTKWSGYALGSRSARVPVWLKRRLSGQTAYWR